MHFAYENRVVLCIAVSVLRIWAFYAMRNISDDNISTA